jgi:hypothetical protein
MLEASRLLIYFIVYRGTHDNVPFRLVAQAIKTSELVNCYHHRLDGGFAQSPWRKRPNNRFGAISAWVQGAGRFLIAAISLSQQGNWKSYFLDVFGAFIKTGENSTWNNLLNNVGAYCRLGS